jgi:hypothetical protein
MLVAIAIWRATFFTSCLTVAVLFTMEFGSSHTSRGDYLLLPKTTAFRQFPEAGDNLFSG